MTALPSVIAGAGADAVITGNFNAVSPAGMYGRKPSTSSGRVWGYFGGRFDRTYDITDGTVTATASTTTYVVGDKITGAVTSSTATTNWNDSTNYFRIALLVADASNITNNSGLGVDHRDAIYGRSSGGGGGSATFIGLTDVPAAYTGAGGKSVGVNPGATALEFRGGVNNQSGTTYTLVAADNEAKVKISNAASNVVTVPPNSSVPFPIGASVAVQMGGAGTTSIAAGVGVTINPGPGASLALNGQNAIAVLTKDATDTWTLTGELTPSLPEYACRAWVNFNGTGTVAIRASGNVSSITDNGVGDYTINFTTAMPDANYSWSLSCDEGSSGGSAITVNQRAATAPTTTALRIVCAAQTASTRTPLDLANICVQIWR